MKNRLKYAWMPITLVNWLLLFVMLMVPDAYKMPLFAVQAVLATIGVVILLKGRSDT